MSGQVQGRVVQGRVPGEEPGHHGERGALEPLGWLEERPGAGLAGPCTFPWLYTGTEPLIVLRISLGVLVKP